MATSSSPSPSASPPHPPPSPSPSPRHDPLLPTPESKSLSPPKKSQPLPWSHQETLALIQAYQEKWYSLKKGQLKAFQWEEVAVTVAVRCGFDEPSKTATQCRHKIEKLRKRYRSEMQKPYPNSWQYFELMDQMERGPMPLNARPITVAKSFSNNAGSISNNNISNFSHGYGSSYPCSSDYYNNNNSNGDGGGSDDSDDKWNRGNGLETVVRNKSKSINNIVRGDVKGGIRSAGKMAMDRGFNSSSSRSVRTARNPVNGKRKQYYEGDDSDDDDDADEDDVDDEEDEEEEEEQVQGDEGGAGMEIAAEIRGFTERFMGMEREKIEMMRETERYRMEMEKKRIGMIVEAQRKIVDTIGRAFGDHHKKAKMAQET